MSVTINLVNGGRVYVEGELEDVIDRIASADGAFVALRRFNDWVYVNPVHITTVRGSRAAASEPAVSADDDEDGIDDHE